MFNNVTDPSETFSSGEAADSVFIYAGFFTESSDIRSFLELVNECFEILFFEEVL
jgi:hypothetical protein